jgi:putative transposase
MINRFLHR